MCLVLYLIKVDQTLSGGEHTNPRQRSPVIMEQEHLDIHLPSIYVFQNPCQACTLKNQKGKEIAVQP